MFSGGEIRFASGQRIAVAQGNNFELLGEVREVREEGADQRVRVQWGRGNRARQEWVSSQELAAKLLSQKRNYWKLFEPEKNGWGEARDMVVSVAAALTPEQLLAAIEKAQDQLETLIDPQKRNTAQLTEQLKTLREMRAALQKDFKTWLQTRREEAENRLSTAYLGYYYAVTQGDFFHDRVYVDEEELRARQAELQALDQKIAFYERALRKNRVVGFDDLFSLEFDSLQKASHLGHELGVLQGYAAIQGFYLEGHPEVARSAFLQRLNQMIGAGVLETPLSAVVTSQDLVAIEKDIENYNRLVAEAPNSFGYIDVREVAREIKRLMALEARQLAVQKMAKAQALVHPLIERLRKNPDFRVARGVGEVGVGIVRGAAELIDDPSLAIMLLSGVGVAGPLSRGLIARLIAAGVSERRARLMGLAVNGILFHAANSAINLGLDQLPGADRSAHVDFTPAGFLHSIAMMAWLGQMQKTYGTTVQGYLKFLKDNPRLQKTLDLIGSKTFEVTGLASFNLGVGTATHGLEVLSPENIYRELLDSARFTIAYGVMHAGQHGGKKGPAQEGFELAQKKLLAEVQRLRDKGDLDLERIETLLTNAKRAFEAFQSEQREGLERSMRLGQMDPKRMEALIKRQQRIIKEEILRLEQIPGTPGILFLHLNDQLNVLNALLKRYDPADRAIEKMERRAGQLKPGERPRRNFTRAAARKPMPRKPKVRRPARLRGESAFDWLPLNTKNPLTGGLREIAAAGDRFLVTLGISRVPEGQPLPPGEHFADVFIVERLGTIHFLLKEDGTIELKGSHFSKGVIRDGKTVLSERDVLNVIKTWMGKYNLVREVRWDVVALTRRLEAVDPNLKARQGMAFMAIPPAERMTEGVFLQLLEMELSATASDIRMEAAKGGLEKPDWTRVSGATLRRTQEVWAILQVALREGKDVRKGKAGVGLEEDYQLLRACLKARESGALAPTPRDTEAGMAEVRIPRWLERLVEGAARLFGQGPQIVTGADVFQIIEDGYRRLTKKGTRASITINGEPREVSFAPATSALTLEVEPIYTMTIRIRDERDAENIFKALMKSDWRLGAVHRENARDLVFDSARGHFSLRNEIEAYITQSGDGLMVRFRPGKRELYLAENLLNGLITLHLTLNPTGRGGKDTELGATKLPPWMINLGEQIADGAGRLFGALGGRSWKVRLDDFSPEGKELLEQLINMPWNSVQEREKIRQALANENPLELLRALAEVPDLKVPQKMIGHQRLMSQPHRHPTSLPRLKEIVDLLVEKVREGVRKGKIKELWPNQMEAELARLARLALEPKPEPKEPASDSPQLLSREESQFLRSHGLSQLWVSAHQILTNLLTHDQGEVARTVEGQAIVERLLQNSPQYRGRAIREMLGDEFRKAGFDPETGELQRPVEAPAPVQAPLPEGPPLFKLAMMGLSIELSSPPGKSEWILGRLGHRVDIGLQDGEDGQTISRRHARIFFKDGQFFIESLTQTSFTLVNGKGIAPGKPHPLKPGDQIRFGIDPSTPVYTFNILSQPKDVPPDFAQGLFKSLTNPDLRRVMEKQKPNEISNETLPNWLKDVFGQLFNPAKDVAKGLEEDRAPLDALAALVVVVKRAREAGFEVPIKDEFWTEALAMVGRPKQPTLVRYPPPPPTQEGAISLDNGEPRSPQIAAEERRIGELDYRGRSTVADRGVTLDGGDRGYFIDRGLEKVNTYVGHLPLGQIEENIREAIVAKRRRGDLSPVRILTIGPGKGRLETELKALFGNDIVIDVFSLTSILTAKARAAIRREFIGNLNLHDFPQGYDRIISICAADHAVDPPRVIQQVARALVSGGEAIFTVAQKQVPGKADHTGMATREYLIDHGIHLAWHTGDPGSTPIRVVYLHKGVQAKDFEWPGEGVLSTTQHRYQLTKGGNYFIYPGEKGFKEVIQKRLEAILEEKGLELNEDRKGDHFLDWLVTTLIIVSVEQGVPIDYWIRRHIEEREKGPGGPFKKKG